MCRKRCSASAIWSTTAFPASGFSALATLTTVDTNGILKGCSITLHTHWRQFTDRGKENRRREKGGGLTGHVNKPDNRRETPRSRSLSCSRSRCS
jgi:hypothetical protein